MKLWDKNISTLKAVEKFTVGNDREFDIQLAPFDVLGSIAHTKMLCEVGIISVKEKFLLITELKNIHSLIKKNKFKIHPKSEDIHSQIELHLTEKLGEVGKKIHTARSRNDQVLLDIKLFLRAEIEKLTIEVKNLFDVLQTQSEKYKNYLLPGYTHFQIAMPSSFGMWFGAYAESLIDDLITIKSAFDVVNKNPLGSAAGFGSSFQINREKTTKYLGFASLNVNSVYAQMTRGKTEKIVSQAISNLADTLSKFSMDVVLYSNQNFGFISFPDELTTGSSIMPHKKNLDVFELIRARTNQIKSLPNEISLITSNLPSGYHRDFQILKENLFPAFQTLSTCIEIISIMIAKIKINKNILTDDKYKYIFSVDEVNKLVQKGTPFRDAYKIIAEQIENNSYKASGIENINFGTHTGSIGNLGNKEIKTNFQKIYNSFPFKFINSNLKQLAS